MEQTSPALTEALSKLATKYLKGQVEYDRRSPVGSGGQGTVYKGTLRSGRSVAVKELRVIAAQIINIIKVCDIPGSESIRKAELCCGHKVRRERDTDLV